MAAIYSKRLFTAPGFTGGPTVVYTVPAGFVAVLHTITVVWGDIIISGLDVWLQFPDGTKLMRETNAPPGDTGGSIVYNGRWTLSEGEQLSAQTVLGTCDLHASGYELTLP